MPKFPYFLELSNGDLVVDGEGSINIYSKNTEDKLDIKLTIKDIYIYYMYEDNNYLIVSSRKYNVFDIKSNYKKITETSKENFDDKIKIEKGLYNEFFEEKMIEFEDDFCCSFKKRDGTYLFGGKNNFLYQIFFDKYGFPELISKIDTGYGYYSEPLGEDCFYSYTGSSSRYYSVGFIDECKNGDIITISELDRIEKRWR